MGRQVLRWGRKNMIKLYWTETLKYKVKYKEEMPCEGAAYEKTMKSLKKRVVVVSAMVFLRTVQYRPH